MSDSKPLVDVEFAISQLGGNTDLLKRMLTKFTTEFLNLPQEIDTLLAAGEIRDAKMKVHTTKGLSGNLGMLALFECSKELDQQLRDDEINQETVNNFAQLMKRTCEFIETLDIESNKKPSFTQRPTEHSHKDLFLQRLQRHEFIDDDTLLEYVNSLTLSDSQKSDLITSVEELQYEKAINIINSL